MQHGVLYGAEPRGLPLTEKLLPQYLKEIGYSNHILGKWHLGSYKKDYTPLYRGFDTHLGYWTGHQDYNDHTASEHVKQFFFCVVQVTFYQIKNLISHFYQR